MFATIHQRPTVSGDGNLHRRTNEARIGFPESRATIGSPQTYRWTVWRCKCIPPLLVGALHNAYTVRRLHLNFVSSTSISLLSSMCHEKARRQQDVGSKQSLRRKMWLHYYITGSAVVMLPSKLDLKYRPPRGQPHQTSIPSLPFPHTLFIIHITSPPPFTPPPQHGSLSTTSTVFSSNACVASVATHASASR